MDKKYLTEKTRLQEEQRKLDNMIMKLDRFLSEKESCFDEKESIKALKRIKEYLQTLKKQRTALRTRFLENTKNIFELCQHEVLIKDSYSKNSYHCPICERDFAQNKIDFPCFLISPRNSKQERHVINLIYEILNQNENILDTFEDHIEDDSIKIYRRMR